MYTMVSAISLWIFFTEIENQLTDYGKILYGLPQGSILGPLLFLINVKNTTQAVKLNLFLYPDVTCLMHQCRDVE